MRRFVLAMFVVQLTAVLAATLLPGCGKDKSPGPDTTPPAAVTDLALLRTTETSLTVTWTAPGDDGDKGRAASYDLRYSLSAIPAGWDSATAVQGLAVPRQAGQQETVTVSGLTRDRIYYLALRTLDDAGNESGLSNVLQAQAGDASPPGRVTDLEIGTLEPRAVTLLFTAPGDDGYVGTATAYEVRKSATPVTESTWDSATDVPVTQAPLPSHYPESIRVSGFTPQETIHIALRARDDGGNVGPVSNDVEVTLPPDTVAPSAIRDLAVGGIELFTQTLTWTAPGNDGKEGRATAYAIRYAEAAITQDTWGNATPVSVNLTPKEVGQREEVTLTDLPGGKWLWFSVRAVDGAGNWSTVSNGTKGYVRREPRTWVIRVDQSGDAPTVQAGIDSAGAGDTVLVHPGRYYENLDYLGKDLVLRSAEGPEATILDGSLRDSSVVVIRRGETRAAVLEGFTITGGRGSRIGEYPIGGGILSYGSSPMIRGNWVVGNQSGDQTYGTGGGIFVSPNWLAGELLAESHIEGNVIEGNGSGQNGGGLALLSGHHEVRGNVFRGNRCVADGAGIWVWMIGGHVLIEGNEFWDNVAGDHGGGVYAGWMGGSPYMIERNLFVRNETVGTGFFGDTGSGGAIAALQMRGVIRQNTLVSNDGHHLTECGGGGILLWETDGSLSVYGNLIAYNKDCGIACWDGTATMGPNLLWQNGGGDLGTGLGECAGEWADVLLFSDPLFCDPENGDYHVVSNSPALTDSMTFGCYPEPGCSAMTAPSTWERIRSLHR